MASRLPLACHVNSAMGRERVPLPRRSSPGNSYRHKTSLSYKNSRFGSSSPPQEVTFFFTVTAVLTLPAPRASVAFGPEESQARQPPARQYGLAYLLERITGLGGARRVTSGPSEGTVLQPRVPVLTTARGHRSPHPLQPLLLLSPRGLAPAPGFPGRERRAAPPAPVLPAPGSGSKRSHWPKEAWCDIL